MDRRVLRGGSWNNNHTWARCASRNRNNSNNRNDNNGFRLLCVSHIFPVPPWHGALRGRCECAGPLKVWSCFRNCPSTTVCGPRRGRRNGAGASRPHGLASPNRRAYIKPGASAWSSLPRRTTLYRRPFLGFQVQRSPPCAGTAALGLLFKHPGGMAALHVRHAVHQRLASDSNWPL